MTEPIAPITRECCNCGDVALTIPRPDSADPMCLPCWKAEYAHVQRHFDDSEIDLAFWASVWAAFRTN